MGCYRKPIEEHRKPIEEHSNGKVREHGDVENRRLDGAQDQGAFN